MKEALKESGARWLIQDLSSREVSRHLTELVCASALACALPIEPEVSRRKQRAAVVHLAQAYNALMTAAAATLHWQQSCLLLKAASALLMKPKQSKP